jgi:hypothetical protein
MQKPPHRGGLDFRSRKLLILNGGQRRDRTADAGLFRAGFSRPYLVDSAHHNLTLSLFLSPVIGT